MTFKREPQRPPIALPSPPQKYDMADQQAVRSTLANEDLKNVKQGGNFEVQDGKIYGRTVETRARVEIQCHDDGSVTCIPA